MTVYTLTRSRRKTLAIHVKPDGAVEVRAPLRLAKREIDRLVASKLQWIERKKEQIAVYRAAAPAELPPSYYGDGEFERTARDLIKMWEQRLGVTAAFVGFRRMTSRWGSCTFRTRRIRLNTALAYCPQECLEYVVVHELTHLRENNHSPRFWATVAGVLPGYKSAQAKLRAAQWILPGKNQA
ncbi:MAG: M48 family metallopeptidase [Clostridiales Family XIII bacterium]|nr:M48 family metallopeptidase [Clostridiales Family XIII bacterium]